MFMDWKSGATRLSWGKRRFRARLRLRRAKCHGSAQRTHPPQYIRLMGPLSAQRAQR